MGKGKKGKNMDNGMNKGSHHGNGKNMDKGMNKGYQQQFCRRDKRACRIT